MAGVPYNYNPLAARLFPQERTFWDKLADYGKDKAQSAFETLWGAATLPGDVYAGRVDPSSEEVIGRAFDIASLGLTGGLATSGMRVGAGMFGGKLAKTADLDKLAQAQKMIATGASPQEAYAATGWFQGTDSQWRFEIDDSKSAFKAKENLPPPKGRLTLAQEIFEAETGLPRIRFANPAHGEATDAAIAKADEMILAARQADTGERLGDVFEHSELFAAYPELAELRAAQERIQGYAGSFDGDTIRYGGIDPRTGKPGGNSRSTMLHELQHGVQNIENFARGSNKFGLKKGTPAWEIYRDLVKKMTTPLSYDDFIKQAGGGEVWPEAKRDYADYVKNIKKDAAKYDVEAQRTAVELAYRRSAGEVEARNVQGRRDMTAEQRALSFPLTTQDIAEELQNFRFTPPAITQKPRA